MTTTAINTKYNVTHDVATNTYSISNKTEVIIENLILKECADKIVELLGSNNQMRILTLLELHSKYEKHYADYKYYSKLAEKSQKDIHYDRADNAEFLLETVYHKIKHY